MIRRAVIVVRTDRDFTDRDCDLQVLSLVRQGLTNRQIARRLSITPGTVRSHLEHAFAKLGVGTRAAAAVAVS